MTMTLAIGWALIHFLWQGTVIAVLLALGLRLLHRRTAATRYAVAVAALIAMPVVAVGTTLDRLDDQRPAIRDGAGLATPDASTPVGSPARVTTGDGVASFDRAALDERGSSRLTTSKGRGWRTRLGSSIPWLVGLWFAGVGFLALRQLVSWRAARRLVRSGVGAPPRVWVDAYSRLAERMGVRQRITLLVSSEARVPAVVGWLQPVVLIPMSALTGLAPAQVELLLAHELGHVRRLDYLVNVVQCAIESLLFYHPATWWVSGIVRREREHCCDDLAVAARGDAVAYAEALVAMEQLRLLPVAAPALGASGHRGAPGSLLERVRRLVDPAAGQAELFPKWIAGATLSIALIAGGVGVRWAEAETDPALTARSTPSVIEASLPAAAATPAQEPRSMAPDTTIFHPDPDLPLEERMSWARSQGRRYRSYWVGYSVDPLWPGDRRSIYVGREIRLGGKSGGVTISGRMISIGDPSRVSIPGTSLLRLVGGRPDRTAILFAFGGRAGGTALDRVQASTVSLPVDFERRAFIWLGSADDEESIALVQRLRRDEGKPEIGVDLVNVLGLHHTDELVVPPLIAILNGRDSDHAREAAAEWLGSHPDRRSVTALARAARADRSRDIRREAAEAMGSLELPEAFDTLASLARTLDDQDARREAVEAIAERPEAGAVKLLIDIARHDRSSDVRREAVETLGEFEDHRGVPALMDLARTLEDDEARREAVETIGEAAPPAEARALLERIAREDESEDVQREAVEALGELEGGEGIAALEAILDRHPSEAIRREAVETLAEAAPDRATERLIRIARDDRSEEVRREAAETLGEIEDPKAATALEELAASEDVAVAREAVEALGETKRVGSLEAVARLAETGKSEEVRRQAIETYGETAAVKQSIELFRRLIDREESESVRHQILESLGELEGKAGLTALLEIAKSHPDRRVRRAAIDELGDLDDEAAADALAKMIEK